MVFGTLPKVRWHTINTDKGAFRNHPCTVWAQDNYRWLIQHGLALCAEYRSTDMIRHTVVSTPSNMQTNISEQ